MMSVKIFILLVILLVYFANNVSANSDEDYVDTVINMLLNGGSFEMQESEENAQEQDLFLTEGVWKCGNCANADDSKLIYNEVNDLDTDVADDLPFEVQISLSIPSMACVAVTGDKPGVVRVVSGACAGAGVTLSVAAFKHFTVNVYTD